MGDITYIKQPSGAAVVGCPCMAASLPTITALAVARGLIRQELDFTQGAYNTSVNASALTHAGGGVGDIAQISQAIDDLLEECGIATYVRGPADGLRPHSHILWIGCPHLHPQAAAQVTAWRNLRNGLRSNAPDRDQTRPAPIRTWREGLAWAKSQLGDELMLTTEDKAWFRAEIAAAASTDRNLGASGPTIGVALQDGYRNIVALKAEIAALRAQLAAATSTDRKLGASGPTIGVALQDGYWNIVALKAEIAAIRAQLAAAGTPDAAGVLASLEPIIADAIARARITVDLAEE